MREFATFANEIITFLASFYLFMLQLYRLWFPCANSNLASLVFQKSYKREHLIIKWILRITHMNKDGEVDFGDWVQDGKVLSK